MRGEILGISGDGAGLISGDDGQRYTFTVRQVAAFHPARGDRVEFITDGTVASRLTLLSSAPSPLHESFRSQPARDTGPASPWGYFVRCLRKYVDGNGRARRSEYWWFLLFRTLLVGPPMVIGWALADANEPSSGVALIGAALAAIGGILFLLTILPCFTATIRRLHDVGMTGWLMLLNLIPYVGGLVILVFTLMPSQRHANEHGPTPGLSPQDRADVFA